MEKVRLKLQKWVNGGYSLGHHDGHAVFVTGGIPGEFVEISIDKQGKKEWFGTVSEVINPSKNRIEVDCSVYNYCGGCSYRHITYNDELQIKKMLLAEMFPDVASQIEVKSGPEFFYRNNVQWQNLNHKIGFYSKFSHHIVEESQSQCRNLDPRLLWSALDSKLRKKLGNQKSYNLRISGESVVDYSKQETTLEINGSTFLIPQKGFFQINKHLTSIWLETMEGMLGENEKVLELFCGCGTIGISLRRKISFLYGIEVHEKSIEYARTNALNNKVNGYEYLTLDLYQKMIPKISKNYPTWIVNPPRAGLSARIMESIQKQKPEKIIYSSCNASTLKRDVSEFKKIGYNIKDIILFDFFPRTPHYEVLTQLQRK